MPETNYIFALEEIYRLALRSEGKRERRTRQICLDLLGEARCAAIRAMDVEARQAAKSGKEGRHAAKA